MPEIIRLFGYSFLFYANDHEPIHIHVVGKGSSAKFVWSDESSKFELVENFKIKGGDIRKIQEVINNNEDLIKTSWIDFFINNKKR